MSKRLDKQFDFFREIDKEKSIKRQTYLTDGETKENDAEHAWHMAVMAILLSEYANERLDVLKTVTMLLIHDIVEIDAGDTYAYDEDGKKTQRQREKKAADRIFGLLPDDQGKRLYEIWEEFEAAETAEAKFAHTMDKLQPVMLNSAADGRSWSEHGVKLSQILSRNKNTADGSKTLWEYSFNNFIKPNLEKGRIKNDVDEKLVELCNDCCSEPAQSNPPESNQCCVYYTYMLRCEDNSVYTGVAADLEKRMNDHFSKNKDCAKYTKTHAALRLDAAWESDGKAEACRLEYRIKQLPRNKKEQLINDNDFSVFGEKLNCGEYRRLTSLPEKYR